MEHMGMVVMVMEEEAEATEETEEVTEEMDAITMKGEHCRMPISFGIVFSNGLFISHEMNPIVAGILGSRVQTTARQQRPDYGNGGSRKFSRYGSQKNAGISNQNNYYSSKNRDR